MGIDVGTCAYRNIPHSAIPARGLARYIGKAGRDMKAHIPVFLVTGMRLDATGSLLHTHTVHTLGTEMSALPANIEDIHPPPMSYTLPMHSSGLSP